MPTSNQRSKLGRSTCRPYECQLITSTDIEIRSKVHDLSLRTMQIFIAGWRPYAKMAVQFLSSEIFKSCVNYHDKWGV